MFAKGEHIVCGNKGVCVVEEITTLNISGVDRDREYYILKPVYVMGSTVYVPVDGSGESLRRVIESFQAEKLIQSIPEIPLLTINNEKLVEQEYRKCMRMNCCEGWVQLIKTIQKRKQKRLATGRKVTTLDARYLRMAQDFLYGELAICLKMTRDEVERSLEEKMIESSKDCIEA